MFFHKARKISFTDFNPELQILIRAGEIALDVSKIDKLDILLKKNNEINWERVYQLACIHQIRPLLLRGVSNLKNNPMPPIILQKLKQDCVFIAGRSLSNTQEMLRLLTLFKENTITAVPYKGAYLANTYYGDFGLREFTDIDLFVHEHELSQIKKVMQHENYIPQWDLNPQQEKAFLEVVCEYNYNLFDKNERGLFLVEPHFRSSHKHYCINLRLEHFDKLNETTIYGKTIPILTPEAHLILTFTNHGINDGWCGLKTLFDMYKIIQKDGEQLDWDFINDYLEKLHLVPSFKVGLAMLDCIFETHFSIKIKPTYDSIVEKLVPERLDILNQYTQINLKTQWRKFIFNLKSRTDWGQKIKMIYYQFAVPDVDDMKLVLLPDYLSFLYIFVRPYRIIQKRILNIQ